ncbi:MAG: hypothetical protein IPK82_34810 [Polyangiaceae bacterium]|nr:hypothetical protein [Polyangiaceae bacterium]
MTSLRSAHFPAEHVIAELAAFPLASVAALQTAAIDLTPTSQNGAGLNLWRFAEREVLAASPSFSVDELTSLRDALWFGGNAQPLTLSQYVRRLAKDTLEPRGNVLVPRVPEWSARPAASAHSGADDRNALARRVFRWLSFAMPPDLLVAAHPDHGAAARIDLVSPTLAGQLRDWGFSESHLHFKGAFDFPLLWISAMHSMANLSQPQSYHSPGAVLNEGRDLPIWLVRAFIARLVLASFLDRRKKSARPQLLSDALVEMGITVNARRAPDATTDRLRETTARSVWWALSDLQRGAVDPRSPSLAAMRRMFASVGNLRIRWPNFPNNLDEAYTADPISHLFPASGEGWRSSEIGFSAEAMNYVDNFAHDHLFRRLFWQVIRVRGILYRHVVQRPLTPGLQWFTRFYARMAAASRPMSTSLLVRSAAATSGRKAGLRAIELRTSPESSYSGTRDLVKSVAETCRQLQKEPVFPTPRAFWRDDPSPRKNRQPEPSPPEHHTIEYGLILHLSRERGGGATRGLPGPNSVKSHADPSNRSNRGYRYARFYQLRRREALTIGWLLRTYPQALSTIRGIDVCTDELGIPTWVMAPLYRYLRAAGQHASSRLAEHGKNVPRLRGTAHAGEDFVHLLGGLRRIDEAVEMFCLCDEDRIGHGIALGVDVERWARSAGGLILSREERLFDLAWEWNFYHERGAKASGGRVRFLTERIAELTEQSFGYALSPHETVAFVRLLHNDKALHRAGFPGKFTAHWDRSPPKDNCQNPDRTPESLLYKYLTDTRVFRNLQVTTVEDPSSEADTLLLLQTELRRKLGSRGLTIELNPSSNLLVGNLGDLEHHPLWRLKPPRPTNEAPIDVCIGTDNPLTAVTRTPEEYQLAYDTLILGGASHAEAFGWIDGVRKAGLSHRFTLGGYLPPIDLIRETGRHIPATLP